VADRTGTPDTSLWSAFSSADTGSIVCLSQAGAEASDVAVPNEPSRLNHPLRRAWWMKHLSLLAVLQAACLAVGLAIHQTMQNAADASQVSAATLGGLSSPVVSAFIWIASVQGAIGYLVFSKIYRHCRDQQNHSEACVDHHRQALARTRNAVILGLSRLAESRDGDTQGHLDRVGMFAEMLAKTASQRPEFRGQISAELIQKIRPSAALHDIGKVGIEDSILQKPGRLTDDERRRMQAHTRISGECLLQIQQCLGDSNFLTLAHEIAVFHHERWDGSGYPSKLAGEAIPLSARIVAIADVYDALSARRVYKDAYAHERCVEIIRSESGKHFDPRLVEVFLEVESEFAQIATNCPDATSDSLTDGDTSFDFGEDDTLIDEELAELDSVLGSVEAHLEASAG
jgi:HD-GYP domain-containing protein (c-di-GMP phosphodiesterase class II)